MENVIFMKDIVEENGKTIYENNMEKSHKFSIGEKVYVKISSTNFQGTSTYEGIATIISLDRDCDGTPLYSIIKTSIETYHCTKSIYHLSEAICRVLNICGFDHGFDGSSFMKIPQQTEYTSAELKYFKSCYNKEINLE